MPPRTNNFVIPTQDGELMLHVSPGPCLHQEHWIDPLQFGFRDSLRNHTGIHALIGLFCVLIQISSKHSEFVWYGRLGIGTWAGVLFVCTTLVGSYATSTEISPRSMRSWLLVYIVFCFFSSSLAFGLTFMNAVYGNANYMSEWQHALLSLLGAIEAFFAIIESVLVMYRLCSTLKVPEGFDLHVLVEYASDGGVAVARPALPGEIPPPSYEQLYRGPQSMEVPVQVEETVSQTATPSASSEDRTVDARENEFPLGVLRRGVMRSLFGWRENLAARS